MQRIGEAKWRPLELCYWPDQGALPAKGKEYPGLGCKRLQDKPPKAQQQQQQQQPAEAQLSPVIGPAVMASSTSKSRLAEAITTFGAKLREFSQQTHDEVTLIKPLEFQDVLDDLEDEVAELSQNLQQMDRFTIDSISFELLLLPDKDEGSDSDGSDSLDCRPGRVHGSDQSSKDPAPHQAVKPGAMAKVKMAGAPNTPHHVMSHAASLHLSKRVKTPGMPLKGHLVLQSSDEEDEEAEEVAVQDTDAGSPARMAAAESWNPTGSRPSARPHPPSHTASSCHNGNGAEAGGATSSAGQGSRADASCAPLRPLTAAQGSTQPAAGHAAAGGSGAGERGAIDPAAVSPEAAGLGAYRHRLSMDSTGSMTPDGLLLSPSFAALQARYAHDESAAGILAEQCSNAALGAGAHPVPVSPGCGEERVGAEAAGCLFPPSPGMAPLHLTHMYQDLDQDLEQQFQQQQPVAHPAFPSAQPPLTLRQPPPLLQPSQPGQSGVGRAGWSGDQAQSATLPGLSTHPAEEDTCHLYQQLIRSKLPAHTAPAMPPPAPKPVSNGLSSTGLAGGTALGGGSETASLLCGLRHAVTAAAAQKQAINAGTAAQSFAFHLAAEESSPQPFQFSTASQPSVVTITAGAESRAQASASTWPFNLSAGPVATAYQDPGCTTQHGTSAEPAAAAAAAAAKAAEQGLHQKEQQQQEQQQQHLPSREATQWANIPGRSGLASNVAASSHQCGQAGSGLEANKELPPGSRQPLSMTQGLAPGLPSSTCAATQALAQLSGAQLPGLLAVSSEVSALPGAVPAVTGTSVLSTEGSTGLRKGAVAGAAVASTGEGAGSSPPARLQEVPEEEYRALPSFLRSQLPLQQLNSALASLLNQGRLGQQPTLAGVAAGVGATSISMADLEVLGYPAQKGKVSGAGAWQAVGPWGGVTVTQHIIPLLTGNG
ncbi:hypothetical protein QJQ45_001268 [Haematococcus lacustris]|nr:hypothetical protein QJQ45_001268 [Haematococcus lacustris]